VVRAPQPARTLQHDLESGRSGYRGEPLAERRKPAHPRRTGPPEGTTAALIALTRPGGRLVTVASPIEPPPGAGVTAWHMVARNDTADLTALVNLVDDGTVRLEVSQTTRWPA
jgi:hypothetical protein